MPLSEDLSERLLGAIIDGTYPPDTALPPEAVLAENHAVSRLTVREAIKALRVQNIVRIQRGQGTFVNAPNNWTALDPAIRAANATSRATGAVSESLLEARRLLEVGAAELAATKRTDNDLATLDARLAEMRTAAANAEVEAFVQADIAFHEIVMRASGNVFIPMMFEPFDRLLIEGRRETSAVAEIRVNAIAQHDSIVRALTSAAPEQARLTMDAHMAQTSNDLHEHVLRTRQHP